MFLDKKAINHNYFKPASYRIIIRQDLFKNVIMTKKDKNRPVYIFPNSYLDQNVNEYCNFYKDQKFTYYTTITEFFDFYCDKLNIRLDDKQVLKLFKQISSYDSDSVKVAKSIILYSHSKYTPIKNLIFSLIYEPSYIWTGIHRYETINELKSLFIYKKDHSFLKNCYDEFKTSDFLMSKTHLLFKHLGVI